MDDYLSEWLIVEDGMQAKPLLPGLLRIPAEIRSQIYDYALGGHVAAYPHPNPPLNKPASNRYNGKRYEISQSGNLVTAAPSPPPPPKRLLSLLLSCRQIYSEALPVLYEQTTFHIQTPHIFATPTSAGMDARANAATAHLGRVRALRLSTADLPAAAAFLRAVPRPVLARVARLRLDCCGRPGSDARAHIPNGFRWRDVWAVVREMRGLRELDVWVCGGDVPVGWQRAVLAPLCDVGPVERYRVFVPWDQESVDAHRSGVLPFRLKRYGPPVE